MVQYLLAFRCQGWSPGIEPADGNLCWPSEISLVSTLHRGLASAYSVSGPLGSDLGEATGMEHEIAQVQYTAIMHTLK